MAEETYTVESKEKSFAVILNPITLLQHKTRWDKLCSALDRASVSYRVFRTTDAESITREARLALEAGFTHILPIGGDGTLSLAAQAFMQDGDNLFPDALLVPLNFGTGHDFYSGLIPKTFHGQFDWIFDRNESVKISLGAYRSAGAHKYFLNSLSLGISREVIEIRSRSRFRSGKISYFLATLKAIRTFKSESVSIEVAGQSFVEPTLLLLLSKGPLVGGGMRLARNANPQAELCAGLWIPILPLSTLLKNLPKLYRGEVDRIKGAKSFHFAKLNCRFASAEPLVEADGELVKVGQSLEIRIIADCLKLLRPICETRS